MYLPYGIDVYVKNGYDWLAPSDDPDLSRTYDGFEWDDAKNAKVAARGFDFDFAARVFANAHVSLEDARQNYGERRFVTTGFVEETYVTVVWTPRGASRRLISAWPAKRSMIDAYHQEIQRRAWARVRESSEAQEDD